MTATTYTDFILTVAYVAAGIRAWLGEWVR